jgi:hypothetical protein
MNIEDFKGQKFWAIQFNEEFCWEIEENGFVVIVGEEHFQAFRARVAERLREERFHFLPRGKFTELEDENSTNLHIGYAREYLEKVVGKAREISFEEFLALNRALGICGQVGNRHLHHHQTNEYTSEDGPKYDYFAWGYPLFYSTIMDYE